MITDIDAALTAYKAAEHDYAFDSEQAEIEFDARDIVVSVSFDMDDPTLLELCRIQLGFVPWELQPRLGNIDFLES